MRAGRAPTLRRRVQTTRAHWGAPGFTGASLFYIAFVKGNVRLLGQKARCANDDCIDELCAPRRAAPPARKHPTAVAYPSASSLTACGAPLVCGRAWRRRSNQVGAVFLTQLVVNNVMELLDPFLAGMRAKKRAKNRVAAAEDAEEAAAMRQLRRGKSLAHVRAGHRGTGGSAERDAEGGAGGQRIHGPPPRLRSFRLRKLADWRTRIGISPEQLAHRFRADRLSQAEREAGLNRCAPLVDCRRATQRLPPTRPLPAAAILGHSRTTRKYLSSTGT